MIVFATGPRSNGTTLLYKILTTGSPERKIALHMPAFPSEFRGMDWSKELPESLFVVIFRDHYFASRSMVKRGFHRTLSDAKKEQAESVAFLGGQINRMVTKHRVWVLSYEGLLETPNIEVGLIDQFLRRNGYAGKELSHPDIHDENAKYNIQQ